MTLEQFCAEQRKLIDDFQKRYPEIYPESAKEEYEPGDWDDQFRAFIEVHQIDTETY